MNWNLLLEWVSECGAGTWAQLREGCEWLGSQGGGERPAWWAAHRLASLGYLEIDWAAQRWSATPPVLTMLPRGGGFAIAAGGRTRTFRTRLSEAAAERSGLWLTAVQQPDAPDALFVQCEDDREVAALARDVGAVFDVLASDHLCRLLPRLDAEVSPYPDGPPQRGFEVRRFDAQAKRPGWVPAERLGVPGLYRVEVFWREETWWSPSAGQFGRVDRAQGLYLELRRCNRAVLDWEPDTRNGTLIVPSFATLPVLHGRAAYLCCGLAPAPVNGALRYNNVPATVASAIASSLGQRITFRADAGGPARSCQAPHPEATLPRRQ